MSSPRKYPALLPDQHRVVPRGIAETGTAPAIQADGAVGHRPAVAARLEGIQGQHRQAVGSQAVGDTMLEQGHDLGTQFRAHFLVGIDVEYPVLSAQAFTVYLLRPVAAPFVKQHAGAERVALVRNYWKVLEQLLVEQPLPLAPRLLLMMTFVWHVQRRVAKWPILLRALLAPRH